MEWWLLLIIGLAVLACPLLMRYGMRGMHGGRGHVCGPEHTGQTYPDGPGPAERLRELEEEITELKRQLTAASEAPLARKDGVTSGGVWSGEGGKPL
jgi:hypothetical protein